MKDEEDAGTRRLGDTGMPRVIVWLQHRINLPEQSPRLRVSPSPRQFFILPPSFFILAFPRSRTGLAF